MAVYIVLKLIYGEKKLSEYVKYFFTIQYIFQNVITGAISLFYKGIEADRNINDLFSGSIHVMYSI